MREAFLQRAVFSDEGTFGLLRFGEGSCYTLELPWRDNRPRVSCIPPGTYECRTRVHARLGRVLAVIGVPGRAGILVHAANLAGDISLGYDAQLQGCIAPFDRYGQLRNSSGSMQRAGLVSRPALGRLMTWAGAEPFLLHIEGALP